VCEPRHTHARTFALHPPIAVGCLVSADASERRVSHANAQAARDRVMAGIGQVKLQAPETEQRR
jgi:hypothetical protein